MLVPFPQPVYIRYVHHGMQYANALPVYHMPEIPDIPPSHVLMVNKYCILFCFSLSTVS